MCSIWMLRINAFQVILGLYWDDGKENGNYGDCTDCVGAINYHILVNRSTKGRA